MAFGDQPTFHTPCLLPPHTHGLNTQASQGAQPPIQSALSVLGPWPHPPAVHDGRVVLPILLLPQHNEWLLGVDPSTLGARCGGSRQCL